MINLLTPEAQKIAAEEGLLIIPEHQKDDVVNHPSHYCTGKYECIEVMTEVFGKKAVQDFCRCNAFKYLYRSDRKNGIEDIKKARWYINKFIDLEEKSDGEYSE